MWLIGDDDLKLYVIVELEVVVCKLSGDDEFLVKFFCF